MQHWRSHLVLGCWRASTYLRIDKHHGLGKTEDPNYFIAQDIVLTTYGIGEFVLPHPMARWPSSPTSDGRHIRIRGVSILAYLSPACQPVACLSLPSTNHFAGASPTVQKEAPRETPQEVKKVHWEHVGPLFRFKWFRIILDESTYVRQSLSGIQGGGTGEWQDANWGGRQAGGCRWTVRGSMQSIFTYLTLCIRYIKSRVNKCSRAVSFLHSDHRWCLSGTPIQNSIEDVFPLFRFLKFK